MFAATSCPNNIAVAFRFRHFLPNGSLPFRRTIAKLKSRYKKKGANSDIFNVAFFYISLFFLIFAPLNIFTMIQEEIAELFFKNKKTLAVAESCTGGYLSHLITSVPGSSEFFKGSVVSYSNEIKRSVLNVRELNLKKHGAVSEFVVNDMAINTMGLFDVDYTIATSGIAGPGGGSEEKPVGTVWICVATTTRFNSKIHHFDPNLSRVEIIHQAAEAALQMLKDELLTDLGK